MNIVNMICVYRCKVEMYITLFEDSYSLLFFEVTDVRILSIMVDSIQIQIISESDDDYESDQGYITG